MIDPEPILPLDAPAAASIQRGAARRRVVPRRSHGQWTPAADRPNPIDLLVSANDKRIQALVPIRMGRMLASPFTFFRGSAAVMAADLATTPRSGQMVQLCGDAHLCNFGAFASPERRLVFDLNDFDETYRGPWEWDVKRLAASVVVAARDSGFPEATGRDLALLVGAEYRRWIRTYAGMRALEVWYATIPIKSLIENAQRERLRTSLVSLMDRASQRDHISALGKLSVSAPGGGWLLRDRPPLLLRLPDDDPQRAGIPHLFQSYLRSLSPERRILVQKHRLLDVALKVVGVGSVGTRCYIALFAGPAGGPLVLQVKEAQASVLSPYIKGPKPRHQGERVVTGQRIMQAVSDSFLGWTRSPTSGTEYYVRQLHDMKYGVDTAGMRPYDMEMTVRTCAWALARAHARSGDPAEIGGYLGPGDPFDTALAAFAVAYADQTERDHQQLAAAVKAGRIAVELGV